MRRTYLLAFAAMFLFACNKGSEAPDARLPNEFDAAGPPGPDAPVTDIDASDIDATDIDAPLPPDAAPDAAPWEAACATCGAGQVCVADFDATCGFVSARCETSTCTHCTGPCGTALCTTANTTCTTPAACTDLTGVFACYAQ